MDALPEFALVRARTLDDVVAARAKHPDSRLIGGGTDLVLWPGATVCVIDPAGKVLLGLRSDNGRGRRKWGVAERPASSRQKD